MSDAIARLWRRMLLATGLARVSRSSDGGTIQQIQASVDGNETIDNVPRLAEFGFTSRPPIGSDVLVIFLSGDRSQGVAVATGHKTSRPRELAEGESMLYSMLGQRIYLSESGIDVDAKDLPVRIHDAASVDIEAAGAITMSAPGGMVFDTPLAKFTGDILDQSATNTETARGARQTYNSHTHNVTNVQGGSDATATNVPNQLE